MDDLLRNVHENDEGVSLKKGKLKGSVEESYIVYDLFYYASKYIKKINDTLGTMVWDDQMDEDNREGEIL